MFIIDLRTYLLRNKIFQSEKNYLSLYILPFLVYHRIPHTLKLYSQISLKPSCRTKDFGIVKIPPSGSASPFTTHVIHTRLGRWKFRRKLVFVRRLPTLANGQKRRWVTAGAATRNRGVEALAVPNYEDFEAKPSSGLGKLTQIGE